MTQTDTGRRHDPVPAGVAPRRGQHPLANAALAVVISVPAIGIGAGVGARYLQKAPLSVEAFVSVGLLVAALALVVYAGVVLWRAGRRWQRLWFVPGVLGVLLLAWAVAWGAAVAVVPPTALPHVTPSARGMSYSDVAFRTTDGARLSAWLVPTRNSAALVVLHGSGSTRAETLPQAEVLARHGYGLLMVDARGHGRSGGRGNDVGWYGDRDIAAAVTFLRHQRGVDPSRIGVLGLSMGGEEAIGAAGAIPAVGAVVAEGATGRTAVDRSLWLPHGVTGAVQRVLDQISDGVTTTLNGLTPPRSLRDGVRRSSAPFLLIAAGTRADEKDAARALAAAAPDRVELWTVPRATHTHGLSIDPAGWEQRVTGFLDRSLLQR